MNDYLKRYKVIEDDIEYSIVEIGDDDGYSKTWYFNGELHRVNGPAIEYSDGEQKWFFDGNPHRINGPAIENINGTKEWYLNGWLFQNEEEYWMEYLNK